MNDAKFKKQIAYELGISRWTLRRQLKKAGVKIGRGLIMPDEQAKIYQLLGFSSFIKNADDKKDADAGSQLPPTAPS